MKDRSHDDAVVDLLRQDPALAAQYVTAALEEADQPSGAQALLAALRQVAERAGIPRESLYRALSSKGNPTLHALGFHLHVSA